MVPIVRCHTFLADANFAADMQMSSSMKSSLTWPPLDWITAAAINLKAQHRHGHPRVLTVDVLASDTLLDLDASLPHGEFTKQNSPSRYAQLLADDIVEGWVGASSKENEIADHIEPIEWVEVE